MLKAETYQFKPEWISAAPLYIKGKNNLNHSTIIGAES